MSEQDPLIGQTLGEFKILQCLGIGGMGKVYLAEQTGLKRQVAIKVLPPTMVKDQEGIERFEREAILAAKLTHPNIAHVYTIGSHEGLHFVAMELVSGGDVARLVKARGRLPVEEAAFIIRQALLALAAAHAEGIIHRDIKPQNLMLSADGTVKVSDFGLARAATVDSSLTASGVVLGTPLYMSPEQARSQPVDGCTDIYALGATFFHMVCGRPPFAGDEPMSILFKHVSEPLPSPKEISSDVPDEVGRIIKKMMEKAPDDRYQSCEDALADLDAYCKAHAISPVRPTSLTVGPEAGPIDMDAATQMSKSYGGQTTIMDKGARAGSADRKPTAWGRRLVLAGLALAALLVAVLLPDLRPKEAPPDKPETAAGPEIPPPPAKGGEPPTGPDTVAEDAREQAPTWAGDCVLALSFDKDTVRSDRGRPTEVLDLSGHGNHVNVRGGARVPGKCGYAIQCDNEQQGLLGPHDHTLTMTDRVTMALWVKTKPKQHDWARLFHKVHWAGRKGYGLFLTGKDMGGGRKNGACIELWATDGKMYGAYSQAPIDDDTWHHVAGTFDGHSMHIYIDGLLDNEMAAAAPLKIRPVARPLGIGVGEPEDPKRGFFGTFDEIAIWRRALSSREVRELYESSKAGASYCQVIGKHAADARPAVAYRNSLGMKFAKIPAGQFLMGSSDEEIQELLDKFPKTVDVVHRVPNEAPQHKVCITRDFFMGACEVTQAQYRAAMRDHQTRWLGDDQPVEQVTWYQAKAFCRWLNEKDFDRPAGYAYRLPTEAEWEYACRAGTTTPFAFDDEAPLMDYGWLGANSRGGAREVGRKRPNAWGLYDMHGNVWEWCEDAFRTNAYRNTPTNDPVQEYEATTERVIRGGSFEAIVPCLRSAYRTMYPAHRDHANTGFRVVLAPATYTNFLGMKLVTVRAGEFVMGSTDEQVKQLIAANAGNGYVKKAAPAEVPRHQVRVPRDFLLGKHEVTVGEFRKFVKSTGYKTEPERSGGAEIYTPRKFEKKPGCNWQKPDFEQTDRHPVACISWNDAKAFCRWLNETDRTKPRGWEYRLPTEAEWEYAAGGAESLEYPWGAEWDGTRCNGKADDGHAHTAPVGSFSPSGDSPFGACDMGGNVWEWCEDWYDREFYRSSPTVDPVCTEKQPKRVLRGGAWYAGSALCRSRWRDWASPEVGHNVAGFRVVLAPAPYVNSLGMEHVMIPPGQFLMGSTDEEVKALLDKQGADGGGTVARIRSEAPCHEVCVTRDFYVGKYEVAVAQYRQFVQATGHKTQAEKEGGGGYDAKGAFLDKANFSWQSPGFAQTDDHPVVCMAWNDAKAFCGWLNATDTTRPEGWSYRLPTEAEWEYVARGSESLTYPWGNEWNGAPCNFKDKSSGVRHADPKVDDGHPRTAPVGTYSRRGNSPFDVADMVGNAWEWCEDYYAPQFYATGPHDDPRNTEVADTRTARGGSWGNEPLECRSALRIGFKPSFRYNGIGFRVVLARPRRSEPRELRLAWSATDRFAAYCVAWADFDNDGDPDLAVGNKWGTKHYQEPGKCQLYRNDEGKLVLAWTAAEVGATECDDLDWGDFDGDGDPDLAVGNDGGHPTRVYENKDGQLSLAWTSPDTDRTCGVDWGDWDGDGDLDLAVANQDQPNRIYRNDGGKFVAAWSSTEMDNSNVAAWADWDGDGDLDLGFGNGARQQSRVYENRDGQLVLAWSSLMSDATCGMAWGDWDGDGDPDLAVANEAEPNYVYENQGGRLVLVWRSREKENTRSLAWGDWDNDGDLDLAAGNEGQPNRIYENVCGNLVVAWTSAEKDHTICVAWADVDGDGFLDLACGNKGPNRVYRNVVAGQALGAPRIPEEAHAALKTSNPNYNERGKFEVEDGQIVEADLANTGVANLAALKGLPLRMLNLRLCRGVRDLSPLKGAPLKHLVIQGTPVAVINKRH